MDAKKLLKNLNLEISKEEEKEIDKKTREVVSEISKEIKKDKTKADVFVGGSFAKGTLVKKKKQDVDIFVRFDKKYEKIDDLLEKLLTKISKKLKIHLKIIHGSRNYFMFEFEKIIFEIIPVKYVKKPEDAENSTDLSYFHVKYVKRKIKQKKNLAKSIVIAKAFCKAQGVYGAESWVHGFSGYALECLVIFYGSFIKMLRALEKSNEKVIIDIEKKYHNKNEILIELNESKRKGPIILVDPTYKRRNVCSALNKEKFEKFKESTRDFLKNPNIDFFEEKKINEEELIKKSKNGEEYCKISVSTNKQEGDIAGAKLEKFYRFVLQEIKRFYEIKESYFEFDEKQEASIYLIVKPNKSVVQIGPKLEMEKEIEMFKKAHKEVFLKGERVYSHIPMKKINDFMNGWIIKKSKQIKEMDIEEIKIK